jgi:hypothetical protein
MLPIGVCERLREQIRQRELLRARDRARGLGPVDLPDALAVIYPAPPPV